MAPRRSGCRIPGAGPGRAGELTNPCRRRCRRRFPARQKPWTLYVHWPHPPSASPGRQGGEVREAGGVHARPLPRHSGSRTVRNEPRDPAAAFLRDVTRPGVGPPPPRKAENGSAGLLGEVRLERKTISPALSLRASGRRGPAWLGRRPGRCRRPRADRTAPRSFAFGETGLTAARRAKAPGPLRLAGTFPTSPGHLAPLKDEALPGRCGRIFPLGRGL